MELFDADGHNTDVTAVEQSETAIPPRFRWFKRLMLFAIFDSALLFGTYYSWSWYADRRLQAEIRSLHDKGQPVLLSDFSVAAIPDSENAAYYYDQAERELRKAEGAAPISAIFSVMSPARSSSTAPAHPEFGATPLSVNEMLSGRSPLDPLNWQVGQLVMVDGPNPGVRIQKRLPVDLADAVNRSAAAIQLSVEAANHPKSAGYSTNGLVQYATVSLDSLAMILNVASAMSHHAGLDADAVAKLEIAIHLANSVDQGVGLRPDLSARIQQMNSLNAWWLSTDLGVTDKPEAASFKSASREQVLHLIAELLDITPFQKAIARYWQYERADFLGQLQSGALATSYKVSSYLTPAMQLEALPFVRYYTQIADCATQLNFPATNTKTSYMPQRFNEDIFAEAHPFARFPVQSDNLDVEFETILYRRVAAVSLAMRLYRMDHNGQWPAALSELAPQYLSSIPADPFSKDNSPLSYLPNAPGGPDLNSAGIVFHLAARSSDSK